MAMDRNEYDDYAFAMLCFICDDCKAHIEPPDYDEDLGDEYQYYIARRAESAGWYISFAENMPCLCPACREKRDFERRSTTILRRHAIAFLIELSTISHGHAKNQPVLKH